MVGGVVIVRGGSLGRVACAGLEPGGGCRSADTCVTKYSWKRIDESISRTVDEIRLDQLVEESRRLNPEGEEPDRSECKN